MSALLNALLLYLANRWPGWDALTFLTAQTALVIGMVNASIVSNLVANLVYLINDTPWLKAVGTIATTTIGIVALVRIWQVLPFDFGETSFDWGLVARTLLVVAIAGSMIGIIVSGVTFLKSITVRPS